MSLTLADWWLFWSTLTGAVVGAVVGGLISFFLARQSAKELRDRDAAERRSREKATAFSLIIKLGKITSSLAALHHQTEEGIATAEARGMKGALWSKMQPIVGIEKDVQFEIGELAVLLGLKAEKLLNSLIILDDQHRSIVAVAKLYAQKRSEFGSLFGAEMIDANMFGSTGFTPEQRRLALPRMAELEALAGGVRAGSKEYYQEAVDTFNGVEKKLLEHFKDVGFPTFEVVKYESTAPAAPKSDVGKV